MTAVGDIETVSGTVTSSKGGCVRGRPVNLMRDDGDVFRFDESTVTSDTGAFSFTLLTEGRYLVFAPKAVRNNARHRHICEPAESPPAFVTGVIER